MKGLLVVVVAWVVGIELKHGWIITYVVRAVAGVFIYRSGAGVLPAREMPLHLSAPGFKRLLSARKRLFVKRIFQ
jgi:hypothetical protein